MFKILLPLNVFAIDVCKNKHIMSFFGSALVASTLTLFVYELNQYPMTNNLSLLGGPVQRARDFSQESRTRMFSSIRDGPEE